MWLKEDGRKDIELMNDEIITQILRKMLPYLENEQMKILQEILQHSFYGLQISRVEGYIKQEENVEISFHNSATYILKDKDNANVLITIC